ncbi:hypothetical protein ACIA8E_05035 [Streptomyces sp. NPDC051664]|uniref:hypothetical protein n=1 Tax=Streptomyces sp. NPDC051664 TaxID=3365668 RepID=UPI0037B27896
MSVKAEQAQCVVVYINIDSHSGIAVRGPEAIGQSILGHQQGALVSGYDLLWPGFIAVGITVSGLDAVPQDKKCLTVRVHHVCSVQATPNKQLLTYAIAMLDHAAQVCWTTLQTQAHRWLKAGIWAEAMTLLKDVEAVPAWQPDPVEIRASLKPLAIEPIVGDGERDRWIPARPRRTRCARRSLAGRCRGTRSGRAPNSP